MYIRCTRIVLTVCLFSLASGCGDSCFLFVSNSGTGTVAILAGNGSSSCQIRKPTPTGAAQFHIDSAETGGQAGQQHVYVTLNGIAGHEDASASLESPGWQELAPELGAHPAQIDLLAHIENSSLFPASITTGVSAGVYRQLGLRFLPRMASRDGILVETGEANPEKNPCGNTGWHCFVDQDGSVQPLILTAEGSSEEAANFMLRISSEQITGGSVVILPETVRTYTLRFEPRLSVSWSRNNVFHLLPAFTISSENVQHLAGQDNP